MRYCYQDNGKNFDSPVSKPVLRRLLFYFITFDVILSRLEVPMPRYGPIRSFAKFETVFLAFAVLFLELWRLFKVDQRYRCEIMGKNVHFPAPKPVLYLLLFYF